MEKHELDQLEGHIQSLKTAHTALADNSEVDELWKIIHFPGWTTVAERMLVAAGLEAIIAQTKQLTTLRQNLLAGARAVGKTRAVGV